METGTIIRNIESAGASGAAFPMFIREAVRNEQKSLEAGRPIYDTVEMIKIIFPGDNLHSPVRLIKESDKTLYAEAYQRFKNEEEQVFDGTPVDAWSRLELKQVYALKAMGFFTVESIANVSDANLPKLGLGGMMLRDMAKAFIEAAKNGGNAERYVAENAQLRTDMSVMAQTIADLKQIIEKMAKEKGADISGITTAMDTAIAQTSNTPSVGKGDLPDDWRSYTFKKLQELCAAHEFAVTPRNRDEAISLLDDYQGRRDALKK